MPKDNWRFLERAFPAADQVLDFFHAAQSLKKAMDQAYGTGSERGLKRWRALRRTLLTEPGGVDRVIASLRYLARRRAPSVSGVVGYFINNRERMDYAAYRAETDGWQRNRGGDEQASRHAATQGVGHDLEHVRW